MENTAHIVFRGLGFLKKEYGMIFALVLTGFGLQ